MKLSKKTTTAIMLTLVMGLTVPMPLAADFSFIEVIPLANTAHGIAFDGSQWHIPSPIVAPGFWSNYEPDFTFIDLTMLEGTSDVRGITYDSSAGTLFVSQINAGLIHEYTLEGVELQNFSVPGTFPEAVAFDASDDTLWIAYFSGTVEHRSRTGVLIDSFMASGFEWSGLTIDPISDTLLLLEDDDTLYELSKDGTLISELVDMDQITDNGLGLHYDPAEAKLYATDQFSAVAVFQDLSRLPTIFFDGFESGDTSAWSNVNL